MAETVSAMSDELKGYLESDDPSSAKFYLGSCIRNDPQHLTSQGPLETLLRMLTQYESDSSNTRTIVNTSFEAIASHGFIHIKDHLILQYDNDDKIVQIEHPFTQFTESVLGLPAFSYGQNEIDLIMRLYDHPHNWYSEHTPSNLKGIGDLILMKNAVETIENPEVRKAVFSMFSYYADSQSIFSFLDKRSDAKEILAALTGSVQVFYQQFCEAMKSVEDPSKYVKMHASVARTRLNYIHRVTEYARLTRQNYSRS